MCLADVSPNLLVQGEKSDERWKTLLKQEENIMINKKIIAVKKREEKFMILITNTKR
jgi:hypothetical protein